MTNRLTKLFVLIAVVQLLTVGAGKLNASAEVSGTAGLWVGEVLVDAVTSIVEDGSPTRPAAGSAPMRIILHADADGVVSLLSQVTLMQTKPADPKVKPVLVVDPQKIAFFEGIKERNGKRVGIRLESVAYDMPRDTSLAAQSEDPIDPHRDDLIDMIVTESTSSDTKWLEGKGDYPDRAAVDQAAIESYLLFPSIRPPSLKEVYDLSWAMTGTLGAGKLYTTKPLNLDPFHRSNPFRHAFHQAHAKGPNIKRTMTIVFDPPDQAITDHFRGAYTETIQGLTKTDLTLTGRLELQRVSKVNSLEF